MRYEGKQSNGKLTDSTGVDLTRNAGLLRQKADATVLSFPKSGRTWLSYMVTAYTGRILNRPELSQHIVDGRLRTLVPERLQGYITGVLESRTETVWAPLILFEHKVKLAVACDKKPYLPPPSTPVNFLLLRDPRDVLISLFHHIVTLYRGKIPGTGGLITDETDISHFIRSRRHGLPQIVGYVSHWSHWAEKTSADILYYEDFKLDAASQLTRFLKATNISIIDPTIVDAVISDTSFDVMRAAEIAAQQGVDAPNRRRMRDGKASSFGNVLSQRDQDYVNSILRDTMLGRALERYRVPD